MKNLDQVIACLMQLLTDDDVFVIAKRAISWQLGNAETRRERHSHPTTTWMKFIHAVRQAVGEVKDLLTESMAPARLNRFVEDWIGTICVDVDGNPHPSTLETTTAPDEFGAVVTSSIAG